MMMMMMMMMMTATMIAGRIGKECVLGPWCFFCVKNIFSYQALLVKGEQWHAAGGSPIY
jgi:hypothetical protein